MIEHFIGAAEVAALDPRLNDPFLFGFEFDRYRCTPFRPFLGHFTSWYHEWQAGGDTKSGPSAPARG